MTDAGIGEATCHVPIIKIIHDTFPIITGIVILAALSGYGA